MTDNNKHLVRVGHEFAAAMSDDTPIITIAKMVTELASALDVQSARSEALAAKLSDVCAENAALKEQSPDVRSPAMFEAIEAAQRLLDEDSPELAMVEAFEILKMKRTPATDAWVNEQRATGVDMVVKYHMERAKALKEVDRKASFNHSSAALDALDVAAQLRKGGTV